MYIGLKNIQQLFVSYPNLLTGSDGIHFLTGWIPFAEASKPYSEHLLYVCEYNSEFVWDDLGQNIHLLCVVCDNTELSSIAGKLHRQISLLLVSCPELSAIYTILQNYYNMQCAISLFGQTLLEYLAFEDGLQPAIEYSYQVFQNPVFVFDANYNLIAATWTAIEELKIHDSIIANKRFTDEAFKMANRLNHIHNRVCKSELPIKAYNEELGYEQMYCTINTQTDLGHLVVSSVNKPFEAIDTELLLILKKYVSQQLKKDPFVRNARGFNHEYFLRDLLDKRIAGDRSNLSRMDYVIDHFKGNMYCIVIETSKNTSTISNIHIRNIIESRFTNSKTLIYHGHIIIVLIFRENQLIPKEYILESEKICRENGLYAGMSNCFQDIMTFESFYIQVLHAIEIGICCHNEPDLFQYRDFYLEHILNVFTQTESAITFCHPKMRLLIDYDKKNHSEFAYTLYMYLIHERNLMATAEVMDMHRTSLVYRFKKINQLIGDDFDDYKERMYLILSYEMNRNK